MSMSWEPGRESSRCKAAAEFAQSVMYFVVMFALVVIFMQGEIR